MIEKCDQILTELVEKQILSWDWEDGLTARISGGNQFSGLTMGAFSVFDKDKEVYTRKITDRGFFVSEVMSALIGDRITDAVVRANGVLTLRFTSGKRLDAVSADNVEAWQLTWIGFTIFSLPGGGWESYQHLDQFQK